MDTLKEKLAYFANFESTRLSEALYHAFGPILNIMADILIPIIELLAKWTDEGKTEDEIIDLLLEMNTNESS